MIRRRRRIRVSVVIPAYNEEGNIDKLLSEFDRVFKDCRFSAEIVLINDGSTDKTQERIVRGTRHYPFVRLIKNRTRMGLTKALTKGFAAAKGDILVFYPADLQFHPCEIPKMVEQIDNGVDMVCGKKVGSYGKWLVSWMYNLLTRILFPKLKVSDMNSIKAFTREVYEHFPTMREGWHRYLAVFTAENDYAVREIPVRLHKRQWGKSKFKSKGRIIKGFTDLIAVKFQISVLGDPMHMFGKISLTLFLIGLIVSAVAFYYRFALGDGYRPLLYVVLFFEISALFTFVMGVITESLVYLRDSLTEMKEENKRLADKIDRLATKTTRNSSRTSNDSYQRENQRSPRRPHIRKPIAKPNEETKPPEIKVRELPNEAKRDNGA